MTLLDWFVILASAYIIFKMGEIYGYWTLAKTIHTLEIAEELEDPEPEIHKLHTEQINDILYLYNHDTKDFVCQASTMEELAKLAKEYKNIHLAAVVHNKKLFLFSNGTVKEHK
jgi:hypothetical protein